MKPKILKIFVWSVFFITVGLVCAFYWLHDTGWFKEQNTEYSVTVVGLIISVIAFVIALLTYVSIDSVSKLTQMDGNVLENENYVTSFPSLIGEYNMKDSKDFGEHVFKNLNNMFKKNKKTAVQFANKLQSLIDLLVFLPYLYHTEEDRDLNKGKMAEILTLINKRKNTLMAVSDGNLVLIEETVKLIESVIHYQDHVSTNDYDKASTLMKVRGDMLRNSVTQVVYYNYLGLFYQKKAIAVLHERYGLPKANIFTFSQIKLAKSLLEEVGKDHDKELFIIYLKESKKAFDKALERGIDDIMWEGFIKYNAARTMYLLSIVDENGNQDVYKVMNEALVARYRLNILIGDILKGEKTHLREAFEHENNLANLVKINILMAEGRDITNRVNQVIYTAPFYEGLEKDPILTVGYNKHFEIIPTLQKEIMNRISETIMELV